MLTNVQVSSDIRKGWLVESTVYTLFQFFLIAFSLKRLFRNDILIESDMVKMENALHIIYAPMNKK